MITNVYSVFDSKLATFGRPWYEMTDASAIRVFSDAVNDGSNPNNQWFKHPEDFSLYMIGQFDDVSGELFSGAKDGSPRPVSLVTAAAVFDFKKVVQLDLLEKNGEKKEPASR